MKNLKLVYSKESMDDLAEIVEYIKKDSLNAAKIFEHNLRKKIKLLKQFPEMGKVADDPRLQGIRILVIGNYLVLYEVESDQNVVYLHGFCHGARDYPNMFKKLK
ncbi:MAG: type II toxin-antitoxin system RelE/ParE family toxin [bacterium]